MQLKNQVEWALHCCAVLAGVPAGHWLPAKPMAEFHGVPKDYLSKALQALSQAGLVEGSLGPAGGYRLARPPSEISFLDVVQAVDGNGPVFVCTEIRRNNPCRPKDACENAPCAIARVMWDAEAAWRAKLAAVSLADLIGRLSVEVDPDVWAASGAWVAARS